MKRINLAILTCLLAAVVAESSLALSKSSPLDQNNSSKIRGDESFFKAQACSIMRLSSNGNRDRSYVKNTTTWKACNNYKLVFQSDGNLVLRTPSNSVLWATGTVGKAVRLAIQSDGNVVLYDGSGESIWATDTSNNPGASLVVQTDGNLVVYSKNIGGRALWSTGTYGGRVGTRNASAEWLVLHPRLKSYKLDQPLASMNPFSRGCMFDGTYCNGPGNHTGVDYKMPRNESVQAICKGVVRYAFTENHPENGIIRNRFTIIEHSDCGKKGQKLYAYYGHINPNVKEGDPVEKGANIGWVAADPDPGNDHLHFGLSKSLISKRWGYDTNISELGWIDPVSFVANSGGWSGR
jgi:hypothetical protein